MLCGVKSVVKKFINKKLYEVSCGVEDTKSKFKS